ncbi:MAG: hypothetical protein OXC05_11320 [Halieaceae bacterium]|nr:hypothetical protein [Halieaceae bacterium]
MARMKYREILIPLLAVCWWAPIPAAGVEIPAGEEYCAAAQQWMVTTRLPVTNTVHKDFDGFVKSKASAQPLGTHQYVSRFRFPEKEREIEGLVSCKFKSADEIAAIHGQQTVAEQKTCQALIGDRLAVLRAALGDSAVLQDRQLVVGEDELARMGPTWFRPWPFDAAVPGGQGQTVLRAKALRVAYKSRAPIPKAFKGVYYCHLPSDEFLQALLLGQISADDQFQLSE